MINRIIFAASALALASMPASATLIGSASFVSSQLDATHFHYELTLDDTGTTNAGTLWFAWLPGGDFMPAAPTNVLSPANWTETVTHGGAGDGYAIRWVAQTGAAITPGNSLSGFAFDSTVTPAEMDSASPFFNNPPVTTSTIYSAGPFSDAGFALVATDATVPEPSTLLPIALAGLLCIMRSRRFRLRLPS